MPVNQDFLRWRLMNSPLLSPADILNSDRSPAGKQAGPLVPKPPVNPVAAAADQIQNAGMEPNEAKSEVKNESTRESGTTNTSENEIQSGTKNTNESKFSGKTEQSSGVSTPEWSRIIGMTNRLKPSSFDYSEDSLNNLRQLLQAKLSDKPQLDYSPMAGLTVALSQDKDAAKAVAGAYNKPQTSEDQAMLLAKLSDIYGRQSNEAAQQDTNLTRIPAPAIGKQIYGTEGSTSASEFRNAMDKMKQDIMDKLKNQNTKVNSAGVGLPRSGKTDDEKIDKLADNLGKSYGEYLPATITYFNRLNALIPGGGIDTWNGEDIPGVGQTGMLHPALLSQQGKAIRNALDKLREIYLRQKSGAQVPDQEFARFKAIINGIKLGTDKDFVESLQNLRKEMYILAHQKEARVDPKVVEKYRSRDGVGSWTIAGWENAKHGTDEESGDSSKRQMQQPVPQPATGVNSAPQAPNQAPRQTPIQAPPKVQYKSDDELDKMTPEERAAFMKTLLGR